MDTSVIVTILGAVLGSSVINAVVNGIFNRRGSRQTRRAAMLERWRDNLRNRSEKAGDITEAAFYGEISSVLRANEINLDAVEGRTMKVPPSQYLGDAQKLALLDAIAELAQKWNLD